MSFDLGKILLMLTMLMEITAERAAMRAVGKAGLFPLCPFRFRVWQVRDVERFASQGFIRLIWFDRGRTRETEKLRQADWNVI